MFFCVCFLQLEDGNDFLSIYDGGSADGEKIAKLTGNINEIQISIPGNQMYLMLNTSDENNKMGFHALIIMESND